MASATTSPAYRTFSALYTHMQQTIPAPLSPQAKTFNPELSSAIASLALHPTLETALHILNNDLPSAHFLVRHMQSPPAFEGMFLHGILHRVEGDYDNARAWYGSVGESEIFASIWAGGLDAGRAFIGEIEAFVKRKQGDGEALERQSRREIDGVVEWCREKFGEGEVRDARDAWVQPGEHMRKMTADMIVGGEGWRKF